MGTQVQCEAYFSGSNSVRDLNKDAYSSWSPCYEDKILGEHLYKGFVLRPSDGYLEYDKKMLKQIMLQHEAVFKRQVCELHRVYKIQKDLMDELQKKGLYSHLTRADTLPSNSFSWQMHHLPMVRTSCNTIATAVADDMRPPLNFLEEMGVQSSEFPVENGCLRKDNDICESKSKRFPTRMFDLQLPADVYIDAEDAGTKGKENLSELSFTYTVPSNKVYTGDPMNATKLTLGAGDCLSHREDGCKWDSFEQNSVPVATLADSLSTNSTSTHYYNLRTQCEARGQELPSGSNMSLLGVQTGTLKDRHIDKGSWPNFTHAAPEERRQDWSIFNSESGKSGTNMNFFSPGFHSGKLPMSSELIQQNPAKSYETFLPGKIDTWLGQKPSIGIEISVRTPCLAMPPMPNNLGPSASGTPGFFSVIPNLDYTFPPPSVSALTTLMNTTDTVQALPTFGGNLEPNAQSKKSNTDTWQHIGDLSSHLKPGNVSNSANINIKDGGSPFWNVDVQESEKPVKGKSDVSSCGISWLTRKPACNESVNRNKYASQLEFSISQGYPKSNPSRKLVDLGLESREQKEGLSLSYSQDFPSDSQVDNQTQRIEVSGSSSGKMIIGFPILDKTHASALSLPTHRESSTPYDDKDREKDSANYTELLPDIKTPSLENQLHAGGLVLKRKRLSNLINLNFVYTDNPPSSPEDELEVVPLRPTTPIVESKVDSKIDLEENTHHPGEELVPTTKMISSDDTESSQKSLISEAAESIIQMSLDKRSSSHTITCEPSPPAPSDALQWFAGVVLSKVLHTTISGGDGLDHFEMMTLMLEETKSDVYPCRPMEPENMNEEEKDRASLLLTRPRRVRGKGRRQRRDFQKDILPGLASLTRYEVNEDIQIIRGLMESSGKSWEVGLKRRNGMLSQARRRKPKSSAVTVADIQISPQQPQPTDPELEIDRRTMISWGRTTKRRGRDTHRLASQRLATMMS